MKMKRHDITPEQYRRTNKTLWLILTICYLIYVVIDISNVWKGADATSSYIRCAVYVGIIIVNAIVVKRMSQKNLRQ